jgi:hypothetical protein
MNGTGQGGTGQGGIAVECFPRPGAAARHEGRKARTRAAIVAACRAFMQAGEFRPPMQACCDRAARSIRTGFQAFGSVEVLHLEAADDRSTRDAIIERVLGCERAALPAETLQRLVRAFVTGAA